MYFSIAKNELPCLCSPNMGNPTGIIFRFENPMTQVVGFWAKLRRVGSSDFQIGKWHALYIQDVSTTIDELYSDVAAPPRRDRRSARLSVTRLLSAGAGSGLETKSSALGAHLSVDTYS